MTLYRVNDAQVRDAVTGELNTALAGQPVQIVVRDTTTPFPIQNGAGDPITDSLVAVTPTFTTPWFWIDVADPSDLYLDWYHAGSGARGPVDFDAVSRDAARAAATSAEESASSSLQSAASAATSAADVSALRGWVDLGVSTRNLVIDPRATTGSLWTGTIAGGGSATEAMVTGATDGPVLPDGTRVTTYARYTITTPGSGNGIFGFDGLSGALPVVPSGKSLAVAIYVRSSLAATSISVRKEGWLAGVAAGAVQSGATSALPASTWQRRTTVVVNNADFDEVRVAAQFSAANQTAGQVIEVTAALLIVDATTVPDHFDGDTPSTNLVGYGWEGARDASVSRRIDMRLVRSVNGQTPDASGNITVATGGGGTSDHNALSNLTTGDPHTQYLTPTRGDQRYYPRGTVDSIAASATSAASEFSRQRSNHTGTQGIGTITGLQAALDAAAAAGAGPTAVHFIIATSDTTPRPPSAGMVIWLDARVDQSTPPANMGDNDRWSPGGATPSGDLIAPTIPTLLTKTSITASGFTLGWTASTDNVGVTGYEVQRDGSVSYGVQSGTTRAITGLTQNSTTTWRVRARDAAGNFSAWSEAIEVTTTASSDTTAPTVPTGLASSSISGSGFTVTWGAGTDNVGVTGYDIRLNGGTPETVPADPRSKTFTGLAGETLYTVDIRSRDAAGNTSAYVSLGVTTLAAAGETYSVYGSGAPTGTWTWAADGTPYIVIGRGFQCSATGARAVGGRAWIPTAASGSLPSEVTFYLFGPNANIGTTPVQTKVVSTAGATAGSWVEGMFDVPAAMAAGAVWMIGVRFTGAGDAGKYSFGTGTRPNSNEVISNGDLGADLAWAAQNGGTAALSSNFKIGTGSVTSPGEQTQSYGVDILVDLEG